MMIYTELELMTYFFMYSLIGWILEVSYIAVKDRRFRNRGFSNLPLCTMYGVMMVILILIWPEMTNHNWFKFVAAFVVFVVVQSASEMITRSICGKMLLKFEDITPYNGQWMNLLVAIIYAALLWVMTEVFHPMIYIFVSILPNMALKIINGLLGCALIFDLLLTLYIMYKDRGNRKINTYVQKQEEYQSGINGKIYNRIWTRLEKAYPNIENEPELENSYVFAKGICLDKIIWVFLTSALIGDVIEMIYCRLVGGTWMNSVFV